MEPVRHVYAEIVEVEDRGKDGKLFSLGDGSSFVVKKSEDPKNSLRVGLTVLADFRDWRGDSMDSAVHIFAYHRFAHDDTVTVNWVMTEEISLRLDGKQWRPSGGTVTE